MPAPQITPAHPQYEVLVCTYNGEHYIVEQLRSILEQDPPPSRVIISDDGSTDQTLSLVNEMAQGTAVSVDIVHGPGQGVIHNVLNALLQTRAPYVFLADQDDVWLPEKAALFCAHMNNDTTAHLIFSDAWVWHPESDQRQSFWQKDGLRPDNAKNPALLMFHNTVQGASACINQALIKKIQTDERIVMHDWWIALLASTLGRVSTIATPTLLYRQHSSNQLGSSRPESIEERKLANRRKIATRILKQSIAFAERYSDCLSETQRKFFQCYQRALSGGWCRRLIFLLRYRPRHKTVKLTIALWYMILTVERQSATSKTRSSSSRG